MNQPNIADLIPTLAANHGLPELAMTKTAPAKTLKRKKLHDGETDDTSAAQDSVHADAASTLVAGDAPIHFALNKAGSTSLQPRHVS